MPKTKKLVDEPENTLIQEDVLPGSAIRVIEDDHYDEDGEKKKKTLELTLIEAGWSKNGFFYSKEVAESVADHIIERNKLYLDHTNPWEGGPSRSLKDWAATAIESRKENGKAIAIVEMTSNPETQWIYDEAVRDPASIGASIDAMVKVSPYEPEEGEELNAEEEMNRRYIVEEIRFLNSTDFVTYASAGGKVNQVLASLGMNPPAYIQKFETTIKEFEKKLNDLHNNTNTPNRKESDMAEEKSKKPTLTLESLKSDHPEIFNSVKEEVKQAVKAEYQTAQETDKEIKGLKGTIQSLESEKGNLEEQIKTLESEKDELQVKVDEYQTKEAAAAKRTKIKAMVKEAELADEYVSEIFMKDLMRLEEDEEIKSRIEERVNLVNGTDAGVTGNGVRPTKEQQEVIELDDDSIVSGIKS